MSLATAFRNRPLVLGVALVSLALSFWLQFRAGCAGDLKTGTLGDPQRALALEHAALLPFLFSVVVGIASIAMWRVGFAVLALLIGVPLLWLLGIQIEVWGVQYCF
jgi:hypothetical protein